jgi:hypothetical protein
MDAMDLLIERIPPRRDDVRFSKVGGEVRAMLDREEAVWVTQDERAAIGRRAVLEAVSDVCDRAPELKLDWYAVSATA